MADGYLGDRSPTTGQTFSITATVIGDVQVVSVGGRLDGVTADMFDAQTHQLIAPNGPRVVLDLAQVNYVASAGLRSLLLLSKQIKTKGGALVLASVHPRVHDVFEIAGFTTAFAIAATTDAALASLQPAR